MIEEIQFTSEECEKIGEAYVRYQKLEPWNPNKEHSIEYILLDFCFSKESVRADIYNIIKS